MASPLSTPSLRQLQLVTSPEYSPNESSTSTHPSPASLARLKQQRRQSSISYTPSSQDPEGIQASSMHQQRRNSVDYCRAPAMSPPPTHRRRPRPLSIAIPSHNPGISAAPVHIRPQTLTERYAGFLSTIAQKEAQVSEMRTQLIAQERELAILKRQWEKIVRNHLAFPDRDAGDRLTGLDGLDKILRGIQNAAVIAADAVSDASSTNPSPVFSRLSLDSTTPSDANYSSPDTSIDIQTPSKTMDGPPSPPKPGHAARRRSLAPPREKRPTPSSPFSPSSSMSSPSSTLPPPTKATQNNSPRQRDNALAPLPGTALGSAAFSLIPRLADMNFSDIKGGMDKFISPQQQKRASRVFGGLWGAVASPSPATTSSSRKKEKKIQREQVNLMDMDVEEDNSDDDDTIMPSRSTQITVMVPDNVRSQPKPPSAGGSGLDLSITASPSLYLTSSASAGSTPPIREEEKESEEFSDAWNW
jgi:hypothetical protein